LSTEIHDDSINIEFLDLLGMVASTDPVSFTSNDGVTSVNIAANSYPYLDQLLTIQRG